MSVDSSFDVQTGIYTQLSGDSALTALLADGANSVLDHVPAGTATPYIVISDSRAQPLDTGENSAFEVVVSINSYSQAAGMSELRQIMSAIYDSLHRASFAVPSQTLVLCRMLDCESRLEVDGKTRHGIQRFQLITEAV